MIHFKLIDFDESDRYFSWFWLTGGELWLAFGDTTIYEYSKEAMNLSSIRYNNYYLVRFLEDFTDGFERINEPISEKMFGITSNLNEYMKKVDDMYEKKAISYDESEILSRWAYDRSFDSCHLIGGPILYFFRFENTIRIAWETEKELEDGTSLWTAKDGFFDMNFDIFVENIKKFGVDFFVAMDKIVALTLEKEWGSIRVDKTHIANEHQERKIDFYKKLALLEQKPILTTNWAEIENCAAGFTEIRILLMAGLSKI
jgi:hypothetical protein